MILGASTYIIIKDFKHELPPIGSVLPAKMRPSGRLTAYHGVKSPMDGIGAERVEAHRRAEYLYTVDLEIEGGIIETSSIGLDNLEDPNLHHLNLFRANSDLFGFLCDRLKIAIEDTEKKTLLRALRKSPSLLNKIWRMREFAHLRAIVWEQSFPHDRKKMAHVISIRSEADIQRVEILGLPQGVKGTSTFDWS